MTRFIIDFLNLNRNFKKLLIIILDLNLILVSCYMTEAIVHQSIVPIARSLILYSFITASITIINFEIFGFYKIFLRHFSLKSIFKLIFLTTVNIALLLLIKLFLDLRYLNINFVFQHSLFLFILILVSRLLIYNLILLNLSSKKKGANTIIFGTDFEEIKTFKNLENNIKYNIIGFLDNEVNNIGRTIEGVKIYNYKGLLELIKNIKIQNCLIIKNKFDTNTYLQLKKKLDRINIKLLNYTNKNFLQEDTTVNFQNTKLLNFNKQIFKNKTILVTGAAGSIGREICLQLNSSGAKKIIGIDISEYLIAKFNQDNYFKIPSIEMVLGDATSYEFVSNIFKKYRPTVVFHAAANKHVDLVQKNYVYSTRNNLLSLYHILKISSKNKFLKKFVFISTDKSVDSTNYMGITKKIGEILINYFALKYKKNFSSVRFGNVIGSSGSFLEIIKDQIGKGGPITITDKRASRYFMTISDAVNLVLYTASLTCQGGTHVLNMGNPINIFDLTKKILDLNNLKIKDESNPLGDIKIKIIGLRKGEKLHEKLYNKNSKIIKTKNKLIDYEFPKTQPEVLIKKIFSYCEDQKQNYSEQATRKILSYFDN